ncbi:MAG: acyl transferase [Flavobacteriaceae bacterium]|nr:acyl transferase [Flavobacteriaceae bacterium]MDA7728335.1 acyl transferase [Flavobacteriaceae bacterium]MDA7849083.1 acyl transferase [Flavobacteriaceae bacterium]MDG1310296.1 acyl transferase [Flavobacteriaceae bacterium]
MHIKNSIFNIQSETDFKAVALEVFKFQFEHNSVYRSFCDLLYKHPSDIHTIEQIPFLPIEFFKTRTIVSTEKSAQVTFTSSGTTGSIVSKHHVCDLEIYKQSFRNGFQSFYGNIEDYTVLALLPSYLERGGSSLVYMANDMIAQSKQAESGFYLHDLEALKNTLLKLEAKGKKTLLIGVSYALLDLIEAHSFELKHTIVMETGGMKGQRKELVKSELHALLKKGFGVDTIHSEYGMTELLSQAYSNGKGLFETPPWMKILTRDPEDALTIQPIGKSGGVNIIDLANINSCAFIATQDLGKIKPDGRFEVLGRFDQSDIRGCNLMVL